MANENPDQRISQQIEKTADFYEPAVYELLSFYQALENQPEPLDGQFIPLSTVQYRSAKDTKIFAVGLIPPSSNVTGRLLDRSASIRNGIDENIDLPEEVPDVRSDPFLVRPNAGLVQSGSLSSHFGVLRTFPDPTKDHVHQGIDIQAPLGAEIRAADDGVVVDISPDGQRRGYGNTIIIQHSDGTLSLSAHMSRFGNVSVGTKVVGGSVIGYVGNTSAPVSNPGPHLHYEVLAKAEFSPGSPATGASGIVVNRTDPPRLEPLAWLDSKGRSIASSKGADEGVFQPTFSGDGPTAKDWNTVGADNASKASKTASKVAGKDLNQTNLGKAFMAQQLATIKAMQAALEQMAKTPPLRLLVNPQSFKVSAEKIISDGNWGRNGPVIEHWGENQDKIEGSGKVAAFYSMDAYNANGPGLTRTARQFSKSYQNLLSLWLIYKNNGGVWFPDPIVPSGSRAKNLSVVGSIYIYYDEILYIGSFDNFNLTETETAPFTLEYSFSFTVRAWYLLDHLDDSQYTYGQPLTSPTVFGSPTIPTLATGTTGSPLMGGNNEQPSPNVALPSGSA
jgi:murein DD-endopeptidase MepM/ murein hydrolase activator NlpD